MLETIQRINPTSKSSEEKDLVNELLTCCRASWTTFRSSSGDIGGGFMTGTTGSGATAADWCEIALEGTLLGARTEAAAWLAGGATRISSLGGGGGGAESSY